MDPELRCPQRRVSETDPATRHKSHYFTRSKMIFEYKAAGILPWAVVNGIPFALLGAEPRRTGPGGSLIRIMCKRFGCSPSFFSEMKFQI